MSQSRRFVASVAAVATATSLVVAAPSAGAWETKYDRGAGTCTISFDSGEKAKVNAAFKTLFLEMAKHTDNEDLKKSLTNAANDPFFKADTGVITMTPDEALEQGGLFYGIDLFKLLLPYGVKGVIDNLDVASLLTEENIEDLLKDVDLEAVIGAVDLEPILEEIDLAGALKTLPVKDVVNEIDMKKLLPSAKELAAVLKPDPKSVESKKILDAIGRGFLTGNFDESNRLIAESMGTTLGGYLERFFEVKSKDIADELLRALNEADIDMSELLQEALRSANVKPKDLIRKIIAQPEFKKALKDEIGKVNFEGLVDKVLKDEKGNIDVEKLLGYKISDVTLAAEEAIRSVGPQVAGPILTMNDAFTACSMHSDEVKRKPSGSAVGSSGTKQGSSDDHVKGSVADGSSLDMNGLIGLGIFGVVAALLGMTVAGYALRPVIDDFMKQL